MNKNLILALLVGGAIWYFTKNGSGNMSTDQKRSAIIKYINQGGDSPESKDRLAAITAKFSSLETDVVYAFFYQYLANGLSYNQIPNPLRAELDAIRAKYNIFT